MFYNLTNFLKIQLQEKDNIIGILHFKYGKEFPNINITIEDTSQESLQDPSQDPSQEPLQEQDTSQISTTNSIEKGFKGIKISSNRGLKMSKR